MKRLIITLAVALAATSCAKRPDAIVPVDIPMAAYGNLDCQALSREYLTEQAKLVAVSKQQNDAATGDAVGVFLIAAPMSSVLGGDKEGQVAVSKGKVNAIEANLRSKGCGVPATPKPAGSKIQR
ncbi:hypothetical protein [Agrobacterium rosae]|uniref:hypothetical protein n=1 Tax=Agrobacterium rosae TaxID=1972867 RepID=UPI002033E05F|nr:hypothetical protein [Agrobacterium rosae]MCM2432124.1 hypothetical protein [Agrobacterium rosae]